ncbi:MAG: L,D-transpeptidase family protein [Thermoguttaceae bacterium]
MNSLKTSFMLAVLAAAAAGLYVSLHRRGDTPDSNSGPAAGQAQLEPAPAFTGPSPSTSSSSSGLVPNLPSFAATPPAGGSYMSGTAASTPGAAPPAVSPATQEATNRASASPAPYASSGGSELGPPTVSFGVPPEKTGGTATATGTSFPPSMTSGSAALRAPLDDAANTRPPLGSAPANSFQARLDAVMRTVQARLDEGRLADAHLALSSLFGDPALPPEHVRQITGLLDQMAATVIYSRQHLLEPPYHVRVGDTLESIAAGYDVPWQVLARINGIRDPQNLRPGRELKIVRGPFSAQVDLNHLELTLMLKGRYAGRFPIGIGMDHPKLEGTYVVVEKTPNPPYNGPRGVLPPDDPANPLGKLWIGLGDQVGIHGTNNPQGIGRADNHGSICLSDRDIEDVYGILSVGSRVIIQR